MSWVKWAVAAGAALIGVPLMAGLGVLILVLFVVLGGGGAQSGGGGQGTCTVTAGAAGTELKVTNAAGESLTLSQKQLSNAAELLAGAVEAGASHRAQLVLFMAAFQESKFWIYANTSAVPESASVPHDEDGSDHDSVGMLQQRPSDGWGTVQQLMNPRYSARAFLGGPDGPNQGNPPGLADVAGWEQMELGAAADAVQISKHPERYETWKPAAEQLLSHLRGSGGVTCSAAGPAGGAGGGGYPLANRYPITDGVGPRPCQVYDGGGCAASTWHPALDFAAPCGEPVLAARPGEVVLVSALFLTIKAPDGALVSYLHMYQSDILVSVGQQVTLGQQVGVVGSAPPSTGCHLDFRVSKEEATDPAVQAIPLLEDQSRFPGGINPIDYMKLYGVDLGA